MEILKVKAPSKINFGLNVIEKREDGFHNIQTIFYPIHLFDVLSFENADNLVFTSSNEILNREEDNLVLKAVRAIEDRINKPLKMKIYLEKKIPVGAGLGGGSSDAASVLLALRKIYNSELVQTDLNEIAAAIGSDVIFFLNPVPSFAYSRGEILENINFRINNPILVVYPGINISTKWAYENIIPQNAGFDLRRLAHEKIDFKELSEKVRNDFEEIVFDKFPEIMEIKSELYKLGAEFALMSGSGSSVFGIFPDLESAEKAKKNFSNKYFTFIHYENK